MRRGTTPTNTFTSDLDLSEAEVVYITYEQDGATIIEKNRDDITFDTEASTMSVMLTQAETLALSSNTNVSVQVRARFSDGKAVGSNIVIAPVSRILKDGEI